MKVKALDGIEEAKSERSLEDSSTNPYIDMYIYTVYMYVYVHMGYSYGWRWWWQSACGMPAIHNVAMYR